MKYLAIAALFLLCLASSATAGGRLFCQHCRSNSHSTSGHYYAQQTHAPQTSSQAITTLAGKKVEWEGIVNSLGQLGFVPAESAYVSQGNYSVAGEVSYAPQGATVYGYSSYAQPAAPIDMESLYEKSGRLIGDAQKMASDASSQFLATVQQQGANQAVVEAIRAQGEAAERALLAARGEPTATPASVKFMATVTQNGTVEIAPVEEPAARALSQPDGGITLSEVFANRCNNCHSGETPKGGLNLAAYDKLDDAKKLKTIDASIVHISSPDPATHMPRADEGQDLVWLSLPESESLYREKFSIQARTASAK